MMRREGFAWNCFCFVFKAFSLWIHWMDWMTRPVRLTAETFLNCTEDNAANVNIRLCEMKQNSFRPDLNRDQFIRIWIKILRCGRRWTLTSTWWHSSKRSPLLQRCERTANVNSHADWSYTSVTEVTLQSAEFLQLFFFYQTLWTTHKGYWWRSHVNLQFVFSGIT